MCSVLLPLDKVLQRQATASKLWLTPPTLNNSKAQVFTLFALVPSSLGLANSTFLPTLLIKNIRSKTKKFNPKICSCQDLVPFITDVEIKTCRCPDYIQYCDCLTWGHPHLLLSQVKLLQLHSDCHPKHQAITSTQNGDLEQVEQGRISPTGWPPGLCVLLSTSWRPRP